MSSDPSQALLAVAPRLVEGVEWQRLALSPKEGFLLSRIDGVIPARLLVEMSGIPRAEVVAALVRLESLGVIRWNESSDGRKPTSPPPASSPSVALGPPSSGAIEAEHDDPSDLPLEEKRAILAFDRSLDRRTCWDLLGLYGQPTSADVKRAYFAMSRRFHPDRFFGRNLGTYKERLERIFKAVKAAYETLADEESRARYAARHPPPQIRPADPGEPHSE